MVGQVAAAAEADDAWPDDDDDPELPDEVVVVPMVLLKVQPASATAITTIKTAIMPYDEIFTVILSTLKNPLGNAVRNASIQGYKNLCLLLTYKKGICMGYVPCTYVLPGQRWIRAYLRHTVTRNRSMPKP
jgi:hypothetical protein